MGIDKKTIVKCDQIDTPIGKMVVYATDNGICLLEFEDRKNIDKQIQKLSQYAIVNIEEKENPHINLTKKELTKYFEGNLREFSVAIDMIGTDFQKKVWNQLLAIPYGEVVSYQQQADKMGLPSSVRAVANANGWNKIAIIIPCHRVIGSNRSLTGYAGGLARKQFLLELESYEKGLFS